MITLDTQLNGVSAYIADILSFAFLLIIGIGNFQRFRGKKPENRILMTMFFVIAVSLIMDPLAFYLDGKEGTSIHIALIVLNSFNYMTTLAVSIACFLVFVTHVYGFPKKRPLIAVFAPGAIGLILIIINTFTHFAFSLENNVYARQWGYWLFAVLDGGYVLVTMGLYFFSLIKGKVNRFYPFYLYLIPVVVGVIIQSIPSNYGISVIWAGITVGYAGLLASIQTEDLYKDELTGLFNRRYLNYLIKHMMKNKNGALNGIMLDINGFKTINDDFGHDFGDMALVDTTTLLQKALGSRTTYVRFAGDEFIILLNGEEEKDVQACIAKIQEQFAAFNAAETRPYKLTFAAGYAKFDPKVQSADEFMREIDKRMYEDKTKYYDAHPEIERRKR